MTTLDLKVQEKAREMVSIHGKCIARRMARCLAESWRRDNKTSAGYYAWFWESVNKEIKNVNPITEKV